MQNLQLRPHKKVLTSVELDSSHGSDMPSLTLIRVLGFSFPKEELKERLQPSPAEAILRNAADKQEQRFYSLFLNSHPDFSSPFNTEHGSDLPNRLHHLFRPLTA